MAGAFYKSCALCVALAIVTTGVVTQSNAALQYETVFLSGDIAPGTNGAVFYNLAAFSINRNGQTAFHGWLSGDGITDANDQTLWHENSGSFELIVREGDLAPGTSGARIASFESLFLTSEQGRGVFAAELTGPGVTPANNFGIWTHQDGAISKVARNGDPAPGASSGQNFISLSYYPSMNLDRQIAFGTRLSEAQVYPTIYGLWVDRSGVLEMITRDGDAAPGTGDAVFAGDYCGCDFYAESLDSGRIVFSRYITGPNVTDANNVGIWSYESGTLALVVREGQAAPGTGGAVFSGGSYTLYDNFNASFSQNGNFVLTSELAGIGVTNDNDQGMWSDVSGTLGLILREGDNTPGVPDARFTDFGGTAINSAGQIAFTGSLTGPSVTSENSGGIWLYTAGSIQLMVRKGDAAPGIPGASLIHFNPPDINNNGSIVFLATLSGPGIDQTNNTSYWAIGPDNELKLIVRKGALFDVNDDPLIEDLRRIKSISYGGLSDNDRIALRLLFDDDTQGIFVATIPEPGTLGLLGVGVGLVIGRRGKRLS